MSNNNGSMDDVYFPDRNASNLEKEQPSYGLKFAKAMYARYTSDSYSMQSKISRFTNNRKYAEGLQDIAKYRDTLDLDGDLSFLNLDWNVVPIISKFVDLLVGEMMNQDLTPVANAIDDQSMTEFDDAKQRCMQTFCLKT